jgi:hypothetical protein
VTAICLCLWRLGLEFCGEAMLRCRSDGCVCALLGTCLVCQHSHTTHLSPPSSRWPSGEGGA